jgi:hypothetical protein
MTDTINRRAEDPRIAEHSRTLLAHGHRLSGLEAKYDELAPKVEIVQAEKRLESRLGKLESVVEGLAVSLSSELKKLTEQVGIGMTRLNDINEEMMRQQARQVSERHRAEMEMKEQQIADLKAAAKSKSLDELVDRWGKTIITAAGALGIVWLLWEYLVKAVH